MKTFRAERLLDLARAGLLVTALLALATAAVWAWAPEWVEQRDAAMVASALEPTKERFAELDELPPGAPEAIAGLEALVEDLRGERRGELLGETRRQALKALARSHDVAGNRAAAVAPLEEAVAFDEHDIDARLSLARHLLEHDDRREEGRLDLAYLYSRVPEDVRVSEAYAQALADEGKFAEALEVAAEHDRRSRSLLWRVYWKPNPKASVKKQALVVPRRSEDGVLHLAVTMEGPVRYLQLNLPERVAMSFEDPVLKVRYAGVETETRVLDDDEVHLAQLFVNGRTLSTTGRSNAFLSANLKSSPKAELTEIVFEAPFAWGTSPVLVALAGRPELTEALAAPDCPFDPSVVAQLAALRLEGAFSTPFELFWSAAGKGFDGKRKARGSLDTKATAGGLEFTSTIEVKRKADQLRLDLPEPKGLTWEFTSFEVVYEDESVSLDPASLAVIKSHAVSRAGARFTVDGGDPWFVFALPANPEASEPARVMSFRFKGSVR